MEIAPKLGDRVDAVLQRLYAEDHEQRRLGLPTSQRTRNIDIESGRFLFLLALGMQAKQIVEIGSSNAVSTIWLASAAKRTGGTIFGTELIPERAAEANRNLAEAGLDSIATVHSGPAARSLFQSRRSSDWSRRSADRSPRFSVGLRPHTAWKGHD